MSVVRVGASKQYSDNWDNIFSGKRGSSASAKPAKTAKSSKKAAAKPANAAKKPAKKKSGKR